MKAILTDAFIRDLKPKSSGLTVVWDTHEKAHRGFAVFVTPRGVKSFLLAYRVKSKGGKERRMVIERAGPQGLTVAEARRKAHDMRVRIANDHDPLEEQKAARDSEKKRAEAPTIDE